MSFKYIKLKELITLRVLQSHFKRIKQTINSSSNSLFSPEFLSKECCVLQLPFCTRGRHSTNNLIKERIPINTLRSYFNTCTVHFNYFFVKYLTKAHLQLIYKLSRSYKFRHYRVIFRELLFSTSLSYVGHLESKERLRIQPAQLFNFSWWVMWCVQ